MCTFYTTSPGNRPIFHENSQSRMAKVVECRSKMVSLIIQSSEFSVHKNVHKKIFTICFAKANMLRSCDSLGRWALETLACSICVALNPKGPA